MTPQPKVYSYLRFSSPDQLKGDSLRRQLDRSRQWCKENGLTLDESLTMKDLGLSAYTGQHRTKGALGGFLRGVESGTIQPGSILIVESLDRLSRQDVVDAQTQFLNIINAGIEIVTLMDGYRYSKESIRENWTQLVISLTIMSRASEESKTKADRLNSAWAAKRKKATKRPLTAMCPAWLKLNKKIQAFEKIPDRAEVVRRIFDMYLAGNGVYRLCTILNNENVPTFGKSKIWRISSMQAILKNRSVLGEYQPHRSVRTATKRERIPDGDPIKDYYPAIVDTETFYAVQTKLVERTGKGGQKGFRKNLFTHIVSCGVCGGVSHYVNHGGDFHYLRCENTIAVNKCDAPPWPYGDFEQAFLTLCTELDVSAILPNGTGRAKKIEAARLAVDAAKGELADIKLRLANYDKAIDTATSDAIIERFVAKLTDAEGEKKDAEKRLSNAIMALQSAESETASTSEQLKSLQDLTTRLKTTKGEKLIQLRDRIKNAIGQLVKHLQLFPDGLRDNIVMGNAMTGWRLSKIQDEIDPVEGEAVIDDYIESNTGKDHRAMLIEFKAGGYRLLKRHGDEYRTEQASTIEGIEKVLKDAAA